MLIAIISTFLWQLRGAVESCSVKTVKVCQYKILQQGSDYIHTESHHLIVNECLELQIEESVIQKQLQAFCSPDCSSVLTILHIKLTTNLTLITLTDVECEANSIQSQKLTAAEFKLPTAITCFFPFALVTFSLNFLSNS